MVCQTIKLGTECIFMGKSGCTYNGGKCHPTIEQCNGCNRIVEYPTGLYCNAFSEPYLKWFNGTSCSMASHLKKTSTHTPVKKLNPLKASKRSSARG